jgi:hypothetical protein
MKPVSVFFSYSHKDEKLRDKLASHLSILERQELIKSWHYRDISAGTEWEKEIEDNLNNAEIILLLVSPDFLSSNYLWDVEMKRALSRHKAGEARVIPIILRPVDWSGAPFSDLHALPKGAKPVTTWPNRDQAFLDITRGVRQAAQEIAKMLQEREIQEIMESLEKLRKRYKPPVTEENIVPNYEPIVPAPIYDPPQYEYNRSPQYEYKNSWPDWRFMAIIGSVIFSTVLMINSQDLSIRKLHQAAQIGDIRLARLAIEELKSSKDTCMSELGHNVERIISRYGSQGLNMVQGMQTYLEKTTACQYPPIPNAPNQVPDEMPSPPQARPSENDGVKEQKLPELW